MSSQESSPITQWRKTVQEALQGEHWRDPEEVITSATIELILSLLGENDFPAYKELPTDAGSGTIETILESYPHNIQAAANTGANKLRAALRQSLKEMNHDIER